MLRVVIIFRIDRRFRKYPPEFSCEWNKKVVGRKEEKSNERERKVDWWGGLFLGNVIPGYSNLHGKKSGENRSTVDEVLFSSLHLEFFRMYIYIGRVESSFSSTLF